MPAAAAGGMMQVLEGTAQEVFRVLLFLVFTLEVLIISLLPFVGEWSCCCSSSSNSSSSSSNKSSIVLHKWLSGWAAAAAAAQVSL